MDLNELRKWYLAKNEFQTKEKEPDRNQSLQSVEYTEDTARFVSMVAQDESAMYGRQSSCTASSQPQLHQDASQGSNQKRKPPKQFFNSQYECTTHIYSRDDLRVIIATSEGRTKYRNVTERCNLTPSRDVLWTQLSQNGINVPKSVLNYVSTYQELIDYIVTHTRKPKKDC